MEKDETVHNNCFDWMLKYADRFEPPICNKIMFQNQLIMFFIKGPNQRMDFHIEHGEEIFYMIKGNMNLKIVLNGEEKDLIIKEGEIFVLPSRVLHSPRRPENTIGFVIERQRDPIKEIDGIIYFDEISANIKHDVYFHIEDFEKQFREIAIKAVSDIKEGNLSTNQVDRTQPEIIPQPNVVLTVPISLEKFVKENFDLIQTQGCLSLYPAKYQTKIHILSNGEYTFVDSKFDTILWIFEGEALLLTESKKIKLEKSEFYFIKTGIKGTVTIAPKHLILKMNIENN